MADRLPWTIAGEAVQVLADRALHWPREKTLFIADLHLGKADTFRSAGIALPSGGTRHDLARLTRLLERTGATRIIVLGDFLHASARERRWRESWDAWRAAQAAIAIDIVPGNHDRALHRLDLGVHLCAEGSTLEPFRLCHAPPTRAGLHALCGHVHPVVRLPGLAGRWPAFVFAAGYTMLPSFSAFTGGHCIDLRTVSVAVCNGESIVAIGSDALDALPQAR